MGATTVGVDIGIPAGLFTAGTSDASNAPVREYTNAKSKIREYEIAYELVGFQGQLHQESFDVLDIVDAL
jgi:hypothetical protein